MKSLIITLSILVLAILIFSFCFYDIHFDKKPKVTDTGIYYGPVLEGYNEQHFRKTGDMIPNG